MAAGDPNAPALNGAARPRAFPGLAQGVISTLEWSGKIIAAATLGVTFLALLVNVILRYTAGSGIPWSYEIHAILLPWLVAGGIVVAAARRRNIAITLLPEMTGPVTQRLVMLVVGAFLDLPAAVVLLGPLFVTIGNSIGLDPIQLGLMMVVNLSVGLYTPPVGTTLFISAGIARVGIGAVVRSLLPFYLVAIAVLLAISFIPALTIY